MSSDDSLSDSSLSSRCKRQRSPSQSPSSGSDDGETRSRQRRRHDNLSVEVCKDFIHGACKKAEYVCMFAHPHSSVTIERDTVTACADSLRNRCTRGRTCRYFHPPPQIQESLLKGIVTEEVPTVCRDFTKGRCLRAEKCRFVHYSSIDDYAIVCQDYLRAKCKRRTCKFSHTLVQSVPQSLQYVGASVNLPSYPQPRNDREVVPACRDFLKDAWNRDSCKYAHPELYPGASVKLPSYAQLGNDDQDGQVCRDFLRNACKRDSCKFAHHEMHHEPSVRLQSSSLLDISAIPIATILYNGSVPVCRDSLKNACKRGSCKFFHLTPQPMAYFQEHGTLAKLPSSPGCETEQESLPVCKDFLKNACQRYSCKFAHPNSHVKVSEDQVEICRDFRRGLCHRSVCRFYHPQTRSSVEK